MSNCDDDELVAADRAPRWVRWAAWSMAGVLAAVLLGVLVSRHRGAPTAQPNPPPVVPSSGLAPPTVETPPVPPYTAAVAQAGDVRWEVQGATLYVETVVGPGRFARAVPLPAAFAAPASQPKLAVDPITGDAWVVLAGSRPSVMIRVSLTLSRITRQVHWATPVFAAAAYSGHLYLSTAQGVTDLAPHAARPRPVPGLAGATGSVVADPARERLIATNLGQPTRLWTFGPHAAAVRMSDPLPVGETTAAVVHGAIWILGRVGTGAVLERLDPTTLRPTARLRLPEHLGAGAVLIPGSDRSLWLSEPLDGDRLVCADAKTGVALQTWPIPDVNSVAVRRSNGLIAVSGRFHNIDLHRCRP